MIRRLIKDVHRCNLSNKAFRYFSQSSNTQNRVTIQYPFDYTFDANSYNFQDKRFTQQVTIRPINENQVRHYSSVLNVLTNIVNQNLFKSSRAAKYRDAQHKFIHPLLLEKLQCLSKICTQEKLKLNIQICKQSITYTSGYLQIYGWDLENSCENSRIVDQNIPEKRFIHQLDFFREKQILTIMPKQKIIERKKEQLQRQLEQDIIKKQEKKQQRQKLKKFIQQKRGKKDSHKLFFKISDFFLGKRKNKQSTKQDYLSVDLLKGKFKYSLSIQGKKIVEQENIDFYSKWVYHTRGSQPEEIKKDRRRILFDFQFWNRGSFIPVKDFSKDILKHSDL